MRFELFRSAIGFFVAIVVACAPPNLDAASQPQEMCQRVTIQHRGNPSLVQGVWVPGAAIDQWFNENTLPPDAILRTQVFRMLMTTDGRTVSFPSQAGLRPHEVEVWVSVSHPSEGWIERFLEDFGGRHWDYRELDRPVVAGLREIAGYASAQRIFTNVKAAGDDPTVLIRCIDPNLSPQTFCHFDLDTPEWMFSFTAHPDRIDQWLVLSKAVLERLRQMSSQSSCERIVAEG